MHLNKNNKLKTRITQICFSITFITYISPLYAETYQPTTVKQVEQVAVGYSYSCALGSDHTVTCWGGHPGYMAPPERKFTYMSSGSNHACGITTEGTVLHLHDSKTECVTN